MPFRSALLLVSLLSLGAAPPRAKAPPHVRELLDGLVARSIGPATMGGRITSVAVVESDPATHYVGAASGGLWKTTDHGRTWNCVFEGRPHASIGAVAVSPSHPEVVYVGTGEANARNSVSWGNGVFVSRDGGKTWVHAGLADTHHIGRIWVHPTDPNTAHVAALGHIWGPNRQRGLFTTRDGGKSWASSLALDPDTGCIDVVGDNSDPEYLYAAAYRVRRDAFSGGNPATQFGPLAGIFRSSDGGRTWRRATRGLPLAAMGRIGLSISRRDPRVVFAVIQTERTNIREVQGQMPGYGPIDTGGIFVSRDRGESWGKLNDLCPRPFYFGKIRVDPQDESRVWCLGIPLYVSRDGGRSFHGQGARDIHVDYHDLWIDPRNGQHLILAGDGGLAYSQNGGGSWTAVKNLPIGQFYAVAADSRRDYKIYGGLQDNGTWGGPSRTNRTSGILNEDWFRVLGLDGFQCQVAPDDPSILFAEGQYGLLHRIDLRSRSSISIRPYSPRQSSNTFRFNWSSPLAISPHSPRSLYFGSNYLFRSHDRGDTWRILSPDLTHGPVGPTASTGHTLTTIAESPVQRGLLYAGSDDGRVTSSRDDGRTWIDVTARLPDVEGQGWITRIEPSPFDSGTVWLSLSRHRQDDRRPYLFRSRDAGVTWQAMMGDLPQEGPIHVVRVDDRNPRLIYVGTEFGLFVSLNGGRNWHPVNSGLPPCPVHDLVVQSQARELVIGTHGRSLFVLDIASLQDLTPEVQARRIHLFDPRPVGLFVKAEAREVPEGDYLGQNPPRGATIDYWTGGIGKPQLEVVTDQGRVVARLMPEEGPGLHRVVWNLKDRRGEPVSAGEYFVRIRLGSEGMEKRLRVRAE